MQVSIKNEYFEAIIAYIRDWRLEDRADNNQEAGMSATVPFFSLWIEVYVPESLKLDHHSINRHFHRYTIDMSVKGYKIFSGVILDLSIAQYLYERLKARVETKNPCTVNGAYGWCTSSKYGFSIELPNTQNTLD